MNALTLTDEEQALLAGEAGPAASLAARLIVRYARIVGAQRLVPVTSAHIDGCLYHGAVSLDFARRLVEAGGRVRVPATLNVGLVDLLHPELFRGDPSVAAAGRELMSLYERLGCRPTWTCAPYQTAARPTFGEHIAWAESNAVVFVNSVLGARTARYGDFIDICAALIGRVPFAGLHRDEDRLGRIHFRVRRLPASLASSDILFAALGHCIGHLAGDRVPVIDGIETATEDQLKALGAAAASSGSVALFHMVGVTPEAPTLEAAFGGRAALQTIDVTTETLHDAVRELDSGADVPLRAVSVGTPHFSIREFRDFLDLLDGRRVASGIDVFISTGRDVLADIEARGWRTQLDDAGVRLLTDTCTYLAPIMETREGAIMTNSAKWAWYAPANIGAHVRFGSLRECVESAVRGHVWRDASLWSDA